MKLKSPDYKNTPQDEAVADFLSRIQLFQQRYEPIDDKTSEKNFSFIKIFNCGERFLVHKIGGRRDKTELNIFEMLRSGHIQSRVVYFLMNIHVLPRTIYLTRVRKNLFVFSSMYKFVFFQHGESELNVQQRIGGDPPLSANGKAVKQIEKRFSSSFSSIVQYADSLAQYMANGKACRDRWTFFDRGFSRRKYTGSDRLDKSNATNDSDGSQNQRTERTMESSEWNQCGSIDGEEKENIRSIFRESAKVWPI